MAKTVVGLFDEIIDAESVVRELIEAGAQREHISLIRTGSDINGQSIGAPISGTTASGAAVGGAHTELGSLLANIRTVTLPGIGLTHASGPLATVLSRTEGGERHQLLDELMARGISEEDAQCYAEGVRRGCTLVLLRVHDEDAADVARIMERHNARDIHELAARWRERGWTGFQPTAPPLTRDEFMRERELHRPASRPEPEVRERVAERAGDVTLPVIEEEMRVGKRQVQSGAVRIVQEVHERPVEETIRLREEHIRVERRPVDRPISPERIGEIHDRTFEITESREEPVVSKTARIKEEVVVHKETGEREEKVRGTVRSSDVRVEQSEKERKSGK